MPKAKNCATRVKRKRPNKCKKILKKNTMGKTIHKGKDDTKFNKLLTLWF